MSINPHCCNRNATYAVPLMGLSPSRRGGRMLSCLRWGRSPGGLEVFTHLKTPGGVSRLGTHMVTNVQPSAWGVAYSDADLGHKKQPRSDKISPADNIEAQAHPHGHETGELSTSQRRLWLLEQLFPEKPLNRLLLSVSFKGNLDAE